MSSSIGIAGIGVAFHGGADYEPCLDKSEGQTASSREKVDAFH